MIRERYGRIVNLSSGVGQMGNAGQSVYAASKAGIIGFTKAMARELAGRGITVNAVAPGFIDTEMTAQLPSKLKETFLQSVPLGRFGTCEDVAQAVAFLASPAAGYITGQVLNVNGGLYV
jgi:3-oxoacyl-[acyl-carrier protein] reductase